MDENKTIEILKQAMLLEQRGKVFYTRVAQEAKDEDVANFFQLMAREEETHLEYLTIQFRNVKKEKKFLAIELPEIENSTADEILTDKIRTKIKAADFEAVAIQSAMDMENRAIKVYSDRAESATDTDEKNFYKWLAQWEKSHNKLLAKIDSELRDDIWDDNSFWPF